MDIRSWLQEVAILIVVCKIAVGVQDPLESFLPKQENPPELNEFLHSVLDHKDDFNFVRQAARKYQKMKKEISVDDTLNNIMDTSEDLYDKDKIFDKRHVLHLNEKRKFRTLGLLPPNMRKKFQRIRRHSLINENDQFLEKKIPHLSENNDYEDFDKQEPAIQEDQTVEKRMQRFFSESENKNTEKQEPNLNQENQFVEKRMPTISEKNDDEDFDKQKPNIIQEDETVEKRIQKSLAEKKNENFEKGQPSVQQDQTVEKRMPEVAAKENFEKQDSSIIQGSESVEKRIQKSLTEKEDANVRNEESSIAQQGQSAEKKLPQLCSNENSEKKVPNTIQKDDSAEKRMQKSLTDKEEEYFDKQEPNIIQESQIVEKRMPNYFVEDENKNLEKPELSLKIVEDEDKSFDEEEPKKSEVEQNIDKRMNKILAKKNKGKEKQMPKIILLEAKNEPSQKHVPDNLEPKIEENYLPAEIFRDSAREQLRKRTLNDISISNDGENGEVKIENAMKMFPKEKKQALTYEDSLHHGYKNSAGKVMRNDMKGTGHNDVFYVDLQDAAQKEKEKYEEKKFEYDPKRQNNVNPQSHQMEMQKPENNDNSQYNNHFHHNINDEIAFEKALSYEMGPKYQDLQAMYNNNPAGNNLYAVDEGRPDNIQPFYPPNSPSRMQNEGYHAYPPQDSFSSTNEKFFLDNANNMRRLETTTPPSTSINPNGDKKNFKQVGPGFFEITKSRRDNENLEMGDNANFFENARVPLNHDSLITPDRSDQKSDSQSFILSKNHLHPLRIKDTNRADVSVETFVPREDLVSHVLEKRNARYFRSRKLQFFQPEMAEFDTNEESYADAPVRSRRDFLDALGMKNEEDYTEDNPYVEDMKTNNTDIHNDSFVQDHTKHSCEETTTATTFSHRQQDVNDIKHILEDVSNITGVMPIYKRKKKKVKQKRPKKNSEFNDFDDLDDEENEEIRDVRSTNKEIETKILENKEKIANHQTNHNANHIQVRQDKIDTKWNEEISKIADSNLKKFLTTSHKVDKKEDYDMSFETTDVIDMTESTTSALTEFETTTNTAYEQIAHQMDVENEKLAQVVNGHLASKIVTIVFENLRKMNTLKAKFYSGLSRKHVNFAGTIDFDIFKGNETEDVDEARLLLDQVTKVLNKLVINQVRRKLCQRLPDELKDYLDIILNVKNNLESQGFVPNTNQGSYLFQYQEIKDKPPFDIGQLQTILVQLEQLLLSYQNLNNDCQNRAEPVKDYIEKHVKMLRKIINCPSNNCEDKFGTAKRNTEYFSDPLVEKQLESVGLGKNQEFIPNFDLEKLVKSKLRGENSKNEKKRHIDKGGHKSQQYRKLQEAAERIRDKRENEKKIAELFANKEKRSAKMDVDYEEPVVYSLG